MAIHFENLKVGSFRGIKDLYVENLNHVNIIAGDNNSGKTSVLEAMLLLRNPEQFANVLSITNSRTAWKVANYEKFINMFSKKKDNLEISAGAKYNGKDIEVIVRGREEKITISKTEVEQNRKKYGLYERRKAEESAEIEAMEFNGTIECYLGRKKYANTFTSFNSFEISKIFYKKSNIINMVYMSPSEHVEGSLLNKVTQDDSYKELCINILKLFDNNIKDIVILENERGYGEYIRHEILGNMPLHTYGDGIKKVIALANAIAKAVGGILLIDEIDTALHAKHYHDIFSFVIKACRQLEIQLFVTTHSIEAIDALLKTQDYDNNQESIINVITFKKGENQTYARVLGGKEVHEDREEFDFEVRI